MQLQGARFAKSAFILLIAAFIAAGCGLRLSTDTEDRVTQTNFTVMLKEGNQKGVWKTNELAIIYQYQMTPGSIDISGTTELVGGYAVGFNSINLLEVQLLFIDSQGKIIEKDLIHSISNHNIVDSLPMIFESKIPIPEGARAISFAYEGELKGAATNDKTTYNIRFSPARRTKG